MAFLRRWLSARIVGPGGADACREEALRRGRDAAQRGAQLEQRGDAWFANQDGVTLGSKAGVVERDPKPVPFAACLVTGSEGMVGQRLVAMLAARGAKRVVCLDVIPGPTPKFLALAERCRKEHGAELTYARADISSEADLRGTDAAPSPFDGVEVVFHLAAIVGPYHRHEIYRQVNEVGAGNVLEAFVRHGQASGPSLVLVDCSTPSTRYPPSGDINGLMEHEMVYQSSIHEYATTKARGEKAILDSNGRSTSCGKPLATCAVAPHQVYAPEDQLFLPAMIETALSGKLRVMGRGDNIASFTHADNIAHGLIVAGTKLWHEGPTSKAAAEFFVVTDGGAYSFWDVVDEAVMACGMPSLYARLHYPPFLLGLVAYIGVAYTKLTGRFVKLTPFSLRMVLINRTFCTAKARHVLGYSPIVSFEDGWAQTIKAARERYAKASKAA